MSKTDVSLQIIELMFHALSLNIYRPVTALICTLFHRHKNNTAPHQMQKLYHQETRSSINF